MKYTAVIALIALLGVDNVEASCGQHEELIGHNCECKKGYIRFRGSCETCPPEARYSCRDKVCKCPTNWVYDTDNNACREVIDSGVSSQTSRNQDSSTSRYSSGNQWTTQSSSSSRDRPQSSKPTSPSVQSSRDSQTSFYEEPTYSTAASTRSGSSTHGPSVSQQTSRSTQSTSQNSYGSHHERCGINERVLPGGGCDCLLGYTRYDGVNCDKCPENGHWEVNANHGDGGCVCNWDFRMQNGECVPDCGKNERFTSGGGCDCKSGFVRYTGKQCMRECPRRSWWDSWNQRCQCQWGLVWDNSWACV